MASQKKKLQQAATKFRKENPGLYYLCSTLLSSMAELITRSGATEVTVGAKRGEYYDYANN